MANYLTTDTDLTAVANAIRAKGGTSAALEFPSGFVGAIDAISGGGASLRDELLGYTPSGEVYWKPTQNIPVNGICFKRGMSKLTLDFSDAYSFTASNGNSYSFRGCSIPVVVIDGGSRGVHLYSYTFIDCTSSFIIVCRGKLTLQNQNVFRQNSGLTLLDFTYTSGNGLLTNSFYGDSKLATLVLRSAAVTPLGSPAGAFNNTPFASGKAGGTIYVPSALISTYQEATNWSTIFGYGNGAQNKILPIEGSIYETQYADGSVCEIRYVTPTLTNCTSSNTSIKITVGDAYSTTITADSGFTMESVSVTMNNTDVTSSTYDSATGVVSITEVTGSIQIVATAS